MVQVGIMSEYFDFDALNRPRNVGRAWDRGPLERQEVINTNSFLKVEDIKILKIND